MNTNLTVGTFNYIHLYIHVCERVFVYLYTVYGYSNEFHFLILLSYNPSSKVKWLW